MQRSFLFLQGPHGPFLARLGKRLRSEGVGVLRVNFSGGDWLDWHGADTVAYRGRAEDWPAWIADVAAVRRITDLVLYGDCRPLHRAAIEALKPLGVTVHVLEEGYFRPNWITYEKDGVNGHTSIPRKPREIIAEADRIGFQAVGSDPVGPTTTMMVRWCLRHHAARWLATFGFRHYRNHRPTSSLIEAGAWLCRLRRRPCARRDADRWIASISEQSDPFFVLLLQLDSDAQIYRHSPFKNMGEVLEVTLKSFARYAPVGTKLVIKNHPLDNGLKNYARLTRRLEEQLNLSGRVVFLEDGRLPALLARCQGVVTVNSTAGLQALHHGCPTKVLGEAVYAIPGLINTDPLDAFWGNPVKPDNRLYRAFRAVVMARSQHNGSFYTEAGMEMLLESLCRRLNLVTTSADAMTLSNRQTIEALQILDEFLPLLQDFLDVLSRTILDEMTTPGMPAATRLRGDPRVTILHDQVQRISNDLIRAIHQEAPGNTSAQRNLAEICACATLIRHNLLSISPQVPADPQVRPRGTGAISYLDMRFTVDRKVSEAAALEEIGMISRLLVRLRYEVGGAISANVTSGQLRSELHDLSFRRASSR